MSRKKVTRASGDMVAAGASLERIREIWQAARAQAVRSVNSALVQANWRIGQQIVEAEQGGAARAEYGAGLLRALSEQLVGEFGSGFSVSALQYMRAFYLAYPELLATIQHAVRVESGKDLADSVSRIQHAVSGESAAPGTGWAPGHLHNGLSWTHYRALLKVERRQVRDFYPDLIFYHVKLKCYVVVDLKVEKLTHADLGQMQMYVNYYDREIAGVDDQPTIGLILCTDKNEAMARYVLDDKSRQIFASRYQFQLPSEDVLRAELRRELDELQGPGAEL